MSWLAYIGLFTLAVLAAVIASRVIAACIVQSGEQTKEK